MQPGAQEYDVHIVGDWQQFEHPVRAQKPLVGPHHAREPRFLFTIVVSSVAAVSPHARLKKFLEFLKCV